MKHRPRKRFGQNFLHDPAAIARIVQAVGPRATDHLVEIGPGRGALTGPLAASGARVTVIEVDRDLAALLRADPALAGVELIEGDALKVDLTAIAGGGSIRLLGNLPYNISTPLLFHALGFLNVIHDMHFMLQREVVQRMAAGPGSRTYGRLSVSVQYHCRVEPLLTVKPGAFRPSPAVDSTLVRLCPLAGAGRASDARVFARVVTTAFAHRRKQLRNSLKPLLAPAELERLGIRADLRAENLAVADYVRIADHLVAQGEPRAVSS